MTELQGSDFYQNNIYYKVLHKQPRTDSSQSLFLP